jgi:hypothetical protein
MRRVLRIAMWCCWAIALVSLIVAIVTLLPRDEYMEVIGTVNTVAGFAAAFFLVLGFNAMAWPHILGWADNKPTRGGRIGVIASAFVVLAGFSVVAVFLVILVTLLLAIQVTSLILQ